MEAEEKKDKEAKERETSETKETDAPLSALLADCTSLAKQSREPRREDAPDKGE